MAKSSRLHQQLLHVLENKGVVYCLVNNFKGNVHHGFGSICAIENTRAPALAPRTVLTTNDRLRSLWVSPEGHLWSGSADGLIGTTAEVDWPAPKKGIRYESAAGERAWSVFALPPSSYGDAQNVEVLWGINDDNVYAGTESGDIYRGGRNAEWTKVFDSEKHRVENVLCLGGSGPDDVYAGIGYDDVWHFNGKQWSKVKLPGEENEAEKFHAIHTLPNGEVLLLSHGRYSRILYGRAGSMTEFMRTETSMYSMAPLNDNRLLIASIEGVLELAGHERAVLLGSESCAALYGTEDYQPWLTFAGKGRVFVLGVDQPHATFLEYDPRDTDQPWAVVSF